MRKYLYGLVLAIIGVLSFQAKRAKAKLKKKEQADIKAELEAQVRSKDSAIKNQKQFDEDIKKPADSSKFGKSLKL